ncbi:FAD-binding oxidoreductase [Lyngbya confervoides]|uniref:FAD-binding oxidoreductase n=1 Tax=Lyngbya confervoides BDU141951 TaxID=1574623 RepID=A0ABD4SZ06_9CYAN|nr:FAD-binding oxidoreductase [Lyngbya confervoides]MCM1981547.1 FAD-binding oxidoreductase [Lyngbya confervoides BDU141951]
MTLSSLDNTLHSLGQILEPHQIVTAEARSPLWQTQLNAAFLPDQGNPPIVYPQDSEQLGALLTWAHHDRRTVLICGAGSKLGWGTPIPATDLVLSLQHLNRIIDHAVGDLTITVEAGIPFQTLQHHLKTSGQFLPVDPSYAPQATLGGILATRDAGSLRHRYGGVRDLLLGLSFVRADGQRAKAGGRVVKNVAGYDLMKLFTGSFGTLGLLSEVTLRLYPIQEISQTVVLVGPPEAIATLTAQVLNSTLTPVALDLLSESVIPHLSPPGSLALVARFQSLGESVTAQVRRLMQLGTHLASQVYCDQAEEDLWTALGHRQGLQETDTLHPETPLVAKFGLLPQRAVPALQLFHQWSQQQDCTCWMQIHAGSGLGTLKLTASASSLTASLLQQLRSHCEQHQGFLSVLDAPLSLRQSFDVWGYPGNAIATMRKLKHQFDPHRILNPGRYVGGI